MDLGFHSLRLVFLLRMGQLFLYAKLHWWDGDWDKLDIHMGSMCLRCMESYGKWKSMGLSALNKVRGAEMIPDFLAVLLKRHSKPDSNAHG